MQAEAKAARNINKLKKKFVLIRKMGDNSNLTEEQKQWTTKQLETFTQLLESLQNSSCTPDCLQALTEDIYLNIRKVKKKVLFWIKYKSTDVECFKDIKKMKGEGWVSIMDKIPAVVKVQDSRSNHLQEITFPCLAYTNQELCQFAETILKELDVLTPHNISSDRLTTMIEKICGEYNTPSYHNFGHGFNVFQMVYALFKRTELGTFLDKTEMFATLLGALGHDMDHRGYNNMYESKLRTRNELVYYDTAILESMHASILVRLLKDPAIGFLDSIPDANKKTQFRELSTAVILATDMSKHNKLLAKFTESVKATMDFRKAKVFNQVIDPYVESKAFNFDKAADKKRILKNLVHACDIGNPCQKFDTFIYWSSLVTHEFDYQAQKEEKRGVDVTTTFKYKNEASFYAGQIFFAKNFVLPLWEQIHILFTGAAEAVENLRENLLKLEEAKTKAAITS